MKQISADTLARTLLLVVALINQILAILGKGTIDIAENDLYQAVTLIFTIVSTIAAWWKNNSFTAAAIQADELMKELKEDD